MTVDKLWLQILQPANDIIPNFLLINMHIMTRPLGMRLMAQAIYLAAVFKTLMPLAVNIT